ncbi:MAG: short chain dehydrogenase [Acidobacteriota bacterium]
MRIILVGAAGTIGRAVDAELAPRHDIVRIGRSRGDDQCDLTDAASISALYDRVGSFDAVVATAGEGAFAPLAELDEDALRIGIESKLLGQIRLLLEGRNRIADGGSFTFTTGVLSHDPVVGGAALSLANGAIESFARAAAIELPRGLRVNVVSPGVIEEALDAYGPYFRGHDPVPAARAARAYAKSVEGAQTGQVYRVL